MRDRRSIVFGVAAGCDQCGNVGIYSVETNHFNLGARYALNTLSPTIAAIGLIAVSASRALTAALQL